MLTAALLDGVENALEGILVLVDGMDEREFRRSRLARAEVRRQLATIAGTLALMPPEGRRALPEIDWDGWGVVGREVAGTSPASSPSRAPDAADDVDAAAWFAASALVPATISWLRFYRRTEPALFEFRWPR